MKFSVYTILSILLILIITHITVVFKDWDDYREYIAQTLEKAYDAKIHIEGKVKISLIMPKLIIRNVYIQYNEYREQKLSDLVSISKIEIKPSLLSLFVLSLQPKSITLLDMKSSKKNLLDIINTKIRDNVVDFAIKDSHISLEDNCIHIKEISVKKNKKFSGNIKVNDNHYDFSGKINITNKNVDINVESSLINLLFKGKKDQEKLKGNLTLTVNNNSNSVSDLVKIINLNLLSHLIPSESIKISSNVDIDENAFIMTDLNVDSNSIQASGIIQNNRKNNHTNVNISFSKFFIGGNLHTDIKDSLECFKRSIPKNLSLNFNIEASNINYKSKVLDNFHAIVKFIDGKAIVETLFKLPGINKMSYLSGKVSSNNMLSEFDGNLQVEGNDFESFIQYFFPSITIKEDKKSQFTLHSKLHFGPRILSISDITLLNDKESLQGSIKISYTKKHNIVNGGLSIYNLNADKYNLSDLSKVKWLKNFKYNVNIKTSMNDFVLNDTKIKNLDFLLKIEKNKLVANKIRIYGEDFDITGNTKISIDQKHAKPSLDVNFKGKKFNGGIIKLPNLIEKTSNSRNGIQWSTKKFGFLNNIKDFDANININIEKFIFEQNVLKDFHLDAEIENSTITIKQVGYVLENGTVTFQGRLRSDSMYIDFIISDLEINKISKVIGINNVIGQISLNGTIKTHGKSFNEWANNYAGDVNLDALKVKFTNLDLNSFITNLLSNKSKSEIATFANVDIYKGSTLFTDIIGKASISNGICSTSLQFYIDQASGSISANLTLSNFTLYSMFVLFFIPPNHNGSMKIEMHLDGPIWCPKMNFEIDKIFATLKK